MPVVIDRSRTPGGGKPASGGKSSGGGPLANVNKPVAIGVVAVVLVVAIGWGLHATLGGAPASPPTATGSGRPASQSLDGDSPAAPAGVVTTAGSAAQTGVPGPGGVTLPGRKPKVGSAGDDDIPVGAPPPESLSPKDRRDERNANKSDL